MQTPEIRILDASNIALLEATGTDVFDNFVNPQLAAEFLSDPRHHIAAAIADGIVVGFASAVHYVHPDKPAELWATKWGWRTARPHAGGETAHPGAD